MEEVIKMLSEDPEATIALASATIGAGTVLSTYGLMYRDKMGASTKSKKDLELYLDETEGYNLNPVTRHKRSFYEEELERRQSY
jgi:hypothetical protein